MITFSTAAKLVLVGQSLYLVNPGPVTTKSPVLDVRPLPAEIAVAVPRCDTSSWFQVQVIAFGSPSWVNVTPEMISLR